MKFNWIFSKEIDSGQKKRAIELEYLLRPKITRYLLDKFETDRCGDFSCFYFDVDMRTERVWVSNKTPQEYIERLKADFDLVINSDRRLFIA